MPTLLLLPPEIVGAIASHLYLPDLDAFADCRLVCARACSRRLQAHREAQRDIIESGCAMTSITRASANSNLVFRNTYHCKSGKWKDLLIAVLTTPAMAHYIDGLELEAAGYEEWDFDSIELDEDECVLLDAAISRYAYIDRQNKFFDVLWAAMEDNSHQDEGFEGCLLHWPLLLLIL